MDITQKFVDRKYSVKVYEKEHIFIVVNYIKGVCVKMGSIDSE